MFKFHYLLRVSAAAWIFALSSFANQNFRLDLIQYDNFAGIVNLGWQSQPGTVYSIESTTNLTVWEEIRVSGQSLRVPAASGSRTQVEIQVPSGHRRFWRVKKRSLTDIGTLISDQFAYPMLSDVNDSGRVVGYFTGAGPQIGFTWAPGEEIVSFGEQSFTGAVNKSGTVVGTRYGAGKFFSWTKSGGLEELGAGTAIDINEAGDIVGRDDAGGFLWKAGRGKVRIPHLSATEGYTVPEALSDAGHVVGVSLIDGNYYRAFLWTESGGIVDLTAQLSSAASGAADVNSSGQVVGHRVLSDGTSRAFSWTPTGGFVTFPSGCYITDLNEGGNVVGRGYLGLNAFSWTRTGGIVNLGNGNAEAVNELGQVVGDANNAPVTWSSNGDRVELETLSSSPLPSTAGVINNNGVIFGTSRAPDGAAHVVMWTINPPP